ncbi:uncharacterized protein THITE_2113664 [Thermothielavioides terrestris NRRL 8126]|uniref:t-SNARE coiled-coil homology domain-containing protein n=1 Tax=Thermothielavioides terrestris (strain ATCC 38088 / NRRL 8126) TaxID=578455 RepID=G2R3S4_THETT|nr:uncharacterized protein THITE_2113664 [Thermothielavioides terrestris NRRL 8126]AEO65979.1 hypothetical protein THITE_2113664 [Thermothielavioides terrestris NRRL 8126]
MGKFSAMFKKSDEKEKRSNPYAQQPTPPASQYGDQPNRYDSNHSFHEPPQGPPSGLPAGPRPGGLPSRVAPGASRNGNWEANTAPASARSSQQHVPDNSQPPPYSVGTASPYAAGGTPSLAANSSSPSMRSGYSKEKFGAQDGFGKDRFEPAAPASSQNFGSRPYQQPGGYGSLDLDDGRSTPGYNYPPQQTARPSPAQSYGYSAQKPDADGMQMTNQEAHEDEADLIKAEINQVRAETHATSGRVVMMAREARQRAAETRAMAESQGDQLLKINEAVGKSSTQFAHADGATDKLKRLQRPFFVPTMSGTHQKMLDQKMEYSRRRETEQNEQVRQEVIRSRMTAEASRRANSQRVLGSNKPTVKKEFLFEDFDGTQQEQEQEIENNLLEVSAVLADVHDEVSALGNELDVQNRVIDQLTERSEVVIDDIRRGQTKLDLLSRR